MNNKRLNTFALDLGKHLTCIDDMFINDLETFKTFLGFVCNVALGKLFRGIALC